jgi:DNA-binding transcriptional LysR family regulator
LFEGDQHALVAKVSDGSIDVALAYDFDLPDTVTAQPLTERAPHVLLAADDPLAAHNDVSLTDLASRPMVLLDVPPSRNYFSSLFAEHDLKPNIAFHSPSFELVRGMVGQGLGYSLLTTRPASDTAYDGSRLAVRAIREPVSPSRIVVLTSAHRTRNVATESFVGECLDHFKPA